MSKMAQDREKLGVVDIIYKSDAPLAIKDPNDDSIYCVFVSLVLRYFWFCCTEYCDLCVI